MKLGLGTVQFGLDYGLSNTTGQPTAEEVEAILGLAAASGIDVLDTAADYGTAEQVLGEVLQGGGPFRIVTKTPTFKKDRIEPADAADLRDAFSRSLERLRRDRVDAILVHYGADLLAPGGERLYEAVQSLKSDGLVAKTGVSVYSGAEVDAILERFPVDIVQAPINAFDQRLVAGGRLDALDAAGVEVHVRSAFLQGLLLMPPEDVPPYFDPIRAHIEAYHATLDTNGLSPVEGALAYVRGLRAADVILVGVVDQAQLAANVAAFQRAADAAMDFSPFALTCDDMVNPSRWELT